MKICAATSTQDFIYWLRKVLQAIIKTQILLYIKTNGIHFGQQEACQNDRSSCLKCALESAGSSVHEL